MRIIYKSHLKPRGLIATLNNYFEEFQAMNFRDGIKSIERLNEVHEVEGNHVKQEK